MALVNCRECKKEISNKAKKCPHCGTPIRKTSLVAWLVFVLIVLMGIGHFIKPYPSNTAALATIATTNNVESNTDIQQNWEYSSSEDKMTGKNSYYATIKSINVLNFDFPYSGNQHATLTFRTHPQYGKDILFSIEKGQFLCGVVDGCTVLVKFDDSKPARYQVGQPSDHSSATLFIHNYSGFVSKMLKSKKILIQAEFFQEGNRTLEFDVSKFDVKKYKPTLK